MTVFDEISVSFDNPATDPLGYEAVQGKLFCGMTELELQFKERDRAFRKSPTVTVVMSYGEVESVSRKSRWFGPCVVTLQSRSPEKLVEFPGNEVGRVELTVDAASKRDAKRAVAAIEFRMAEAALEKSQDRLDRLRNS